jgi:UDP-GlcNAc:undecaprenyl-phosphate GlcNAc-1-phosphate transferase
VDTIGVMAQRLIERRSPFLPDKNHIHHKLLAAGFFHHEAVLAIYLAQAAMITLALLLSGSTEVVMLATYAAIVLPILALFFLAGRGVRWKRPERDRSRSIAVVRRLRASRWLTDTPLRLLGIGVPVFLALGVFLPRSVPTDFGVLAVVLFGLVLLGLAVFRRAAPFLVRVGLYVGGAFVLYLSDQAPIGADWPVRTALNAFFGVAAILVLVAIRFQRGTRFETTPLDYLLVFVAVMIPNLPEIGLGGTELGLLAAKLLVLFFAYELLLHALSERLVQFGVVSLWVLLGLGIRAWW